MDAALSSAVHSDGQQTVTNAKSLQDHLHDQAPSLRPARKKYFSRAASLDLIDILSRRSGIGLAIIAGASIWLAMATSQVTPGRAILWLLMLLGALAFCRSYRDQFRNGAINARRPFRWRANYTAGLSVLGVVFASAPLILLPSESSANLATLVIGITLGSAIAAGLMHCAHLTSSLAFTIPLLGFMGISVGRVLDPSLTMYPIAASFGAIILSIWSYRLSWHASCRRNPRTTILRRDVETSKHGVSRTRHHGSVGQEKIA